MLPAKEDGPLNRAADCNYICTRLRQCERPRRAVSARIGWREQRVSPFGIEMAIVPGDVLVHHRACRRMGCHVIDAAFTHNEDPPAIAQRFAVIGTGSHTSALDVMAKSPPTISKLIIVLAFYQLMATIRRSACFSPAPYCRKGTRRSHLISCEHVRLLLGSLERVAPPVPTAIPSSRVRQPMRQGP